MPHFVTNSTLNMLTLQGHSRSLTVVQNLSLLTRVFRRFSREHNSTITLVIVNYHYFYLRTEDICCWYLDIFSYCYSCFEGIDIIVTNKLHFGINSVYYGSLYIKRNCRCDLGCSRMSSENVRIISATLERVKLSFRDRGNQCIDIRGHFEYRQ